jgi:rhamnosyltransferase
MELAATASGERQLTAQSLCVVIVTFHATGEMLRNMPKILKQSQRLVVVDNGSSPDEVDALRVASRSLGFHLIENRDNLGIAEGLNQGVRWAKSEGYPWVILFDQDSKITDGFIGRMFAAWEAHPERARVASMHPTYVDPTSGAEPFVLRARDGGPVIALTSGALMPLWIFDKIGMFATEYFIDYVDYEYCYRIRAAGYLIADSREAVLLHSAGSPKQTAILGFSFGPTHHSAVRRYYMSRNRIALCRQYFTIFPGWISHAMYIATRETIKCFLAEQDRVHKFRNFLLGTWDGLTGRMGKRNGI